MPTFSVIIPTFNRPQMLVAAVRSVIAQSFTDYEILVADDGSAPAATDSLGELLAENVRVIRSDVQQGAGAARNRAIEAATGRYISLLDDDDRYLSDFLLRTYETLSNTSSAVGFSWCSVRFVNHGIGTSSEPRVVDKRFPTCYPTQEMMFAELLNIGTGFGLTFKSECLRAIGPFNEALTCVEDADFFLRLLVAGVQPFIIPDILVEIHNHCASRLTGHSRARTRITENEWLIDRYSSFFTRYPGLRIQLEEYISRLKHQLLREPVDPAPAAL
jgi:glycosyltransferase involved in cell wall biosynthesis